MCTVSPDNASGNCKSEYPKNYPLRIGTWNVQGLTDEKLFSISQHMRKYSLDVLCLQETWISNAAYYRTFHNNLVILSGQDEGCNRSFAGVGFIIAPKTQCYLRGFLQYSDRMAFLRLNTGSGLVGVFSVYAPHNLKPLPERVQFYADLSTLMDRCATDGPKFILGDFNARIGLQQIGEESVFGLFGYGAEAAHKVEVPNRDLLFEFCICRDLYVSNTFIDAPASEKVTFREPVAHPSGIAKFALLDLVLAPRGYEDWVGDLRSHQDAALPSNHYLLSFKALARKLHRVKRKGFRRVDLQSLMSPTGRQDFCGAFSKDVRRGARSSNVDEAWKRCQEAMKNAEKHLPLQPLTAKKQWISKNTLILIQDRMRARREGSLSEEKSINKLVKKSVRADKAAWFDDALATGSWEAIKRYRKPTAHNQGRLQNSAGHLVPSDMRASVMATHLENVQWQQKPMADTSGPSIGDVLNVNLDRFTEKEVVRELRKLRNRKACGPDGLPAEYFKVLADNAVAKQWLVDFANLCWVQAEIPHDWHLANVKMVFKKGKVHLCENYRPISLLNIAYKLFASLLRARLVQAGAEARLSDEQFGFRSGRSTVQAIATLRRRIECAVAWKNGRLSVLALDWKRAFDSITISSLHQALERFGLPAHVLKVVRAIYTNRQFFVQDCGETSDVRPQAAGISQGCPLSPFLFVMVMTVMMTDASREMRDMDVSVLLYADDTLIMGEDASLVEKFLNAISRVGLRYGLELHGNKFQLLQVGPKHCIRRPDGSAIVSGDRLTYLGAVVTADGRGGPELSRRLGMAANDFRELSRFWKHARISRERKLQALQAVIFSKLRYGFSACFFNAAELRRLDGFQNRCLRGAVGIKPAFISRISNAKVLETCKQKPLSMQVQKEQLLLFGEAARAAPSNPLHSSLFWTSTLDLRVNAFVRRIGRPILEWASGVLKEALRRCGDWTTLLNKIHCKRTWTNFIT